MSDLKTISLKATLVETDNGHALEILIDGMSIDLARRVGATIREILLENTTRIFGENTKLPQ